MKSTLLLCLFYFCCIHSFCQDWTNEQLDEANTADSIEYLSAQEKQVIQYINLCRLYPKQFADNEIKNYKGVSYLKNKSLVKYRTSLRRDLSLRPPCDVLEFDEDLYDDAHCYATELSTNKRGPHQRINCEASNYAECIFFGTYPGKNIVIEWLIDNGVATLGHRTNCLDSNHTMIGINTASHFMYGHCTVAEFR